MYSLIKKIAEQFANQLFVIDPSTEEAYTYREIFTASVRLANRLYQEGIRNGDLALVILNNGTEYVVTSFALMLLGATLVPLNPKIRLDEFRQICGNSKARFLISTISIKRRIESSLKGLKSWFLDKTSLWGRAIADPEFFPSDMDPDDKLVVLYTSGTTGQPKGVVLTVARVLANFLEYGRQMEFDLSIRFFQVMPVYHADGWNFSLLLPFLHGSSVVITEPFNAKVCASFEQLMRLYQANVLISVPSILTALLTFASHFEDTANMGLKYVICSSEKLQSDLKANFETTFQTRIYDLYGLTETQIVSYYSEKIPWKRGSVGKLQCGVKVQIEDDGEILVRSPYLFVNYLQNPEANHAAFQGDWFKTGDMGYLDQDGYLYLLGRKKDMIVRSGNKISPVEINEVLLGHPAVQEAVTVGVEDEICGEEVYSFVVLSRTVNVSENILWSHCVAQLASEKRPKKVVILHKIPRTTIGKVDKARLIENLQTEAYSETQG